MCFTKAGARRNKPVSGGRLAVLLLGIAGQLRYAKRLTQ